MAIILKREELYRLVWKETAGPLAHQLGITPAKLAQACNLMAVPRPRRGHWNAIKAGKIIPSIPLPQHSGPQEIRFESAREKASVKLGKVPPIASVQVGPRYVTLQEWAEATFSHPPHKHTLFRWANEGRIQPQARKIGRRWWVVPTAEYVPD